MSKGYFVAGTDTGVGKTRAAQALLASAVAVGWRAVGMKPVAAGCRVTPQGLRNDDAEALQRAANVERVAYADVNPYAFVPAISPHLAARESGATIDPGNVRDACDRLAAQADLVVVEGAGGWFAPIGATRTMADIARSLDLPVILVVGMRLGCLNHALLTQAAIAQCGLSLAGWIANVIDPAMARLDDNIATLDARLHAPRLATLPYAAGDVPPTSIDALMAWMAKSD